MGEFPQNPQAVRLEHWATDAERCSDAESGSDSSLCPIRQALDQATTFAATLVKSINRV
jgi:hypothetical protein